MEKLVLSYIRNGKEIQFSVKDIDHAIRLTNEITNSDLLNDDVEFNCFDVIYEGTDYSWESNDGKSFLEYFRNIN